MRYIVLKPLKIKGHRYVSGDVIEDGLINESRAPALERTGYISGIKTSLDLPVAELIMPLEQEGAVLFMVPIVKNEGVMSLPVSNQQLSKAVEIMQMQVKAAAEEINNVEEENVLILLNACDSRKGVKEAAEDRAGVLAMLENEGTSPDETPKDSKDNEEPEESAGDE